MKAISDRLGYDIRSHAVVERTTDGLFRVRISEGGKPCVLWKNGCTIHDVKPKGGREFECWTPETYTRTYFWTQTDIEKSLGDA